MKATHSGRLVLLGLVLLLPASAAAGTQPDTLRLAALREAAARQDPRAVQPELFARATQLRLAALRATRRPQLALDGQATAQNETAQIPIDVPGQAVPSPPHEQFRVQAEATWTLYDGGRTRRQADAERARLAENVAGVAVTLYRLREATTDAFFGALLSRARADALALAVDDLGARLDLLRRQAAEGAALAAHAAALEADQIRLQQQADEAEAAHQAARDVLARLTGLSIPPTDVLAVPELGAEAAQALLALRPEPPGTPRPAAPGAGYPELAERPEVVQLARMAARAEAEAAARLSETRPSLSLFGQAGVGRPSPFDFFSDRAEEYGLVGVRVRWSVFDGGRARRESEALRMQARLAETEAQAVRQGLLREVQDELAELARLEAALDQDVHAIELREHALRVARRQLEAGTLLPDTYADRLTDLADARLTLERHRIERAAAQARLLSTLGHYPEAAASVVDPLTLD